MVNVEVKEYGLGTFTRSTIPVTNNVLFVMSLSRNAVMVVKMMDLGNDIDEVF